ncbi:hypothetical protein PVOR_25158 [Paenibacillus vortex V453]|uniref:Uncharacterized protein n=2 Tax=Paenibacillus TaxID=44249 RepID=A0A2R9SPR0_9BACL|nr:hypothetical protein PVOR_25158 [Paenibacillus vortex V453]
MELRGSSSGSERAAACRSPGLQLVGAPGTCLVARYVRRQTKGHPWPPGRVSCTGGAMELRGSRLDRREQPRAGHLGFSSWALLVRAWLLDTSGDRQKDIHGRLDV